MKIGAGLFWGLFFVSIGIILILKVVFNIHIPIIKFAVALVLIFIGIKILLSKNKDKVLKQEKCDYVFADIKINEFSQDSPSYDVVFSKAVINLRNFDSLIFPDRVFKINAVFSAIEIYLPDSIAVKIESDAVFSGLDLPNGNSSAFGKSMYISPDYNDNPKRINLIIDCVFSGVKIIRF